MNISFSATAPTTASDIRILDYAMDSKLTGRVRSVMHIDEWIRIETESDVNNVGYFSHDESLLMRTIKGGIR